MLMLKKLTANYLDWPKQLKFCLFALRNMPNRDTHGYFPYQLIHESELHGPLELLCHGWFGEERECIDLGGWMTTG